MNIQRKIADGDARISQDERARREAAVNFARGSVRFEGFELDSQVEAINQRFIDGELTAAEYQAAIAAL